jgi:hypothetical protein
MMLNDKAVLSVRLQSLISEAWVPTLSGLNIECWLHGVVMGLLPNR